MHKKWHNQTFKFMKTQTGSEDKEKESSYWQHRLLIPIFDLDQNLIYLTEVDLEYNYYFVF